MNKYKSFYHITGEGGKYETVDEEDLVYPHIAVNIGSGVSVLRVDGLNEVKRISGTLMGGGTLVGLSKLLINVDNYNDIMKLAKMGDNSHTDLLVKDIYGSKASSLGLDGDIIASSFGKIHQMIQANERDKIKKEDIAKSLLVMICYHIAQLGFLVCKQHDIKK
jgi:type II pantothenate kinase